MLKIDSITEKTETSRGATEKQIHERGHSKIMGREILKKARKDAGMTQQQVAEYLKISVIGYRQIESGKRIGRIEVWDKLEDLFEIHQRKLREIF